MIGAPPGSSRMDPSVPYPPLFRSKSGTMRDSWSHDGAYWHDRDILVEPQPVQPPHPPSWVAAQSEASVRQAAARGQSLMLDQFSDTETIGRRIGWYRDEQTRCGVEARQHQIAVTRGLMLVDDEAKRDRKSTRLNSSH